MPVVTRLALGVVALIALIVPASASASTRVTSTSRPLISDNITPVFAVPGVHPIGARIRGTDMFVTGPEGLTVFDITDPEHPIPEGALPLPHFENEDVDLGGNTLLISNDPSEGVGIVYVIDISDPTAPVIASATPNGFVDFCQSCFGTGTEQDIPPGTGHTASCVPGPASKCQYAYLAGTGQGIAIMDLTDPTKPAVVKTFKPEMTGWTTHDVQLDSNGLAWIVAADGTGAYDVSDPLNPKLVFRTDPAIKNGGVVAPGYVPPSAIPGDDKVITDPVLGLTVGGKGDQPIDFIHHDSLRFPAPAAPGPNGEPAPPATDGDPATVDDSAPSSNGGEQQGGPPPPSGANPPPPPPKAKSKSCKRYKSRAKRKRCFRRKRAARRKATASSTASAPRASAAADPTPADTKTYPAGGDGDVVGIVEEDYNRPTCEGAGSFQTWKIDETGVLRLQDSWVTEVQALDKGSGFAPLAGVCSAHYFDQRDGLTANGWYEEGTRFLDVSDPTNIREVGYWIPAKGETWSAIFSPTDPTGQTVYALDVVRGIEVLHIDRGSLKTAKAPVRRAWVRKRGSSSAAKRVTFKTGFSKKSRYGYVCRQLTRRAALAR